MADEEETKNTDQPAEEEAPSGGLVKKLFSRRKGEPEQDAPEEGTAHIPSTVLTVEYVDESEGMDASLRQMEERLRKMQEAVSNMQETQSQLIAAVNQQAKDIGRFIESVGRRIDKLYRRVSGGQPPPSGEAPEPLPRDLNRGEIDVETGPAPEVADDPDHQNAWRIARVLAADLEAYHEQSVKEGVLYGTFHKLLREPLEQARETYEQRVDAEIVENYDYFSKALDELIARKRMELEEEGAL